MWFILSAAALVLWSGSDLFSKLGCSDPSDGHSPLKMVSAVGLVMGLHAAYGLIFGDISLTADTFIAYLPVSALYIASMALGYLGLRYIELSISSPICNTSGAIVTAAYLIMGETISPIQIAAVGLIFAGVLALGCVQMKEDDVARALRQQNANRKYTKSLQALMIPVIYCLLDAAGTFGDGIILETLDESAANTAYELTFFLCGLVSFAYVKLIKKERFFIKLEVPKFTAAIFETGGQLAYVHAIAANAPLAAPMISCYCALSVVWGRLFLKEKLSIWHYCCLIVIFAGIVILGIFDG